MPVEEYVDNESLDMLKDVMAEEFEELLELYVEDASQHLQDLDQAVADGDCSAVTKISHSLKGASSNIYARCMAATCLELEDASRGMTENPDWDQLAELLNRVKACYQETRRLLLALIA
tara:strand:+ start:2553 stop:2909 length:357 start_codon:yes stop_codon:yes gene_type:complete